MRLYNTMTKKKEEFVPIREGKVSMYVCGPTVYNLIHIGNARPMIVFDTFRRYLEYKGYEVKYVSNFTDVDDKIINNKTVLFQPFMDSIYALCFMNETNIMPVNRTCARYQINTNFIHHYSQPLST